MRGELDADDAEATARPGDDDDSDGGHDDGAADRGHEPERR